MTREISPESITKLIEQAKQGAVVKCPRPGCQETLKVITDAATGHTAGICPEHKIIWQE